MQTLATRLDGPILLEPTVHADARGFFLETYRRSVLAELGIPEDFVQDNHSRSARGIVRGMHLQPGMAKLVRCARGSIFDVVVDVRSGSPTFGRWEAVELDDVGHRQLYCPDGFGHGFCVLSDVADVVYRCSAYYDPEAERGFAYDDPAVAIVWPAGVELTASARDAGAPRLAEIEPGLPFRYGDHGLPDGARDSRSDTSDRSDGAQDPRVRHP
ncbi:MAG: dTDP-4-dehydrorhamnose 3,5-epimerase [Solirubrobacteraceae bacterium]